MTYNLSFIFGLCLNISLGIFHFGYSLGSWNSITDPYKYVNNWTDEWANYHSQIIPAVTLVSSGLASLFAGYFVKYGLFNCILASNVFVIFGSLL